MTRPKGTTRAEAPSKPVPVRLSPLELRRACEAARVNHQTVGAFIRDAIVTAASECLEEAALKGSGPTT
jgi:uncharacterized protein (DUF1778 family)